MDVDKGSDRNTILNLYPAFFFIQKISSAYYTGCLYLNALQTNLILEANIMNTDQTTPKGTV